MTFRWDPPWSQVSFRDVVLGEVAAVCVPAKVLAPRMIKRGGGNMIAVGSIISRSPSGSGISPHSTGKSAVDGLVRELATELGPHQIRVDTVAPGFTVTDTTDQNMPAAQKERIVSRTPMGRPGRPEDLAGAIVLMAMAEAQWLTGNYVSAGGVLYMP